MTLHDELRDLAEELASMGWKTTMPDEMTPQEEGAFERVSAAANKGNEAARKELAEHLRWCMTREVTLYVLKPGEEPPPDLEPRAVVIRVSESFDVGIFERHARSGRIVRSVEEDG